MYSCICYYIYVIVAVRIWCFGGCCLLWFCQELIINQNVRRQHARERKKEAEEDGWERKQKARKCLRRFVRDICILKQVFNARLDDFFFCETCENTKRENKKTNWRKGTQSNYTTSTRRIRSHHSPLKIVYIL